MVCNGTIDGWRGAVVRGAGGGKISSQMQSELVNVTKIYSNNFAFAALRGDGTVRAWGHPRSMRP